MIRLPLILILLGALLTACDSPTPAPTPTEPTATGFALLSTTPTALPTAQPAASPNPSTPTPTGLLTFRLWWPDALSPSDIPNVTDLLNEQIGQFSVPDVAGVDFDFRLKRYQDVGGILSTLRSSSSVAPDALPDVTLVRREDLIPLVQAGLIYPLDNLIPSTVISDLYDVALELGQVDGIIYGLPYTLDVLLMAYRLPIGTPAPATWRFTDLLDLNTPWIFPAGRVTGINNVFFLQYLSAGGTLPRPDGSLRINEEALRSVYTFYQAAYDAGLVTVRVFDFSASTDYLPNLITGEYNIAVINSTTYQQRFTDDSYFQPAPLPTDSGDPISIANGWMWVITTPDPAQQAIVADFLTWMMDANRLADFTAAIRMLPARRSVLQTLDANWIDNSLMHQLVENSITPLPENIGGSSARAMQTALQALLSGQITAEEAVEAVISQSG